MAGGLLALLDDVALIARSAAASLDDVAAAAGKTSVKAAGVVVDDAAVTPRFVTGVTPTRELPMIWRITKGSLVNKLIIILPIALLLSWIAPWALTPILMIGGTYLCFEGAEKILHMVLPHDSHEDKTPVREQVNSKEAEDKLVKGAIMTDLILSAEIMVISLNEVADQPMLFRAAVLIVVGIGITALVYGAVAVLVKMDDIGLRMVERGKGAAFGRGLVAAMPKVLSTIGFIGTFAMLWVGGHIIVVGLEEFGFTWPYDFIHGLEVAAGGGFLGWLVNTFFSLIVGLIWGLIVTGIVMGVKKLTGRKAVDSVHHE
ncbi:DUF808 domain-containing protein [Corynebacterium testudinoris]|uniref:DUF808 domain-containing protein n=1 Tax=Corynebacterium testudinoris TaxID=136857 RepID=UPI001C8C3B71|nr:DUF808 domain-containing protein [Corynebacterium testudinoris]MBX8994596.1 DUF808 domain-containing protein [Corynebacterium testudinoris]